MVKDNAILWDKNINEKRFKEALADEKHPRFLEYASLLLSRENQPKEVFGNYLDKVSFCRNWRGIKRRMRQNRWNDARILFWDEVYDAVRKKLGNAISREDKKRFVETDPEIKELCLKLRQARKKAGMTQHELARKAGLSQQSVSFIEKGYVNISLKTLKKVSAALGFRLSLDGESAIDGNK